MTSTEYCRALFCRDGSGVYAPVFLLIEDRRESDRQVLNCVIPAQGGNPGN